MTREEFGQIATGLRAVYQIIGTQEAFDVWYQLLGDLDYKTASMATQAYMQSEHFPPTPADIRKYAEQITRPLTNDMTENEAWALVRKAINNGIYGYKEEFDKLPKLIREVVGRAENIRELAQLEVSELETVEKSHFVRNYRAKLELTRSDRQFSDGLRDNIQISRQDNTPAISTVVVTPALKGETIPEPETETGLTESVQIALDEMLGRTQKCG